MHDSSARYPPPKCHPQTRMTIVNFFVEWTDAENPEELIYWLHAPFGHGKSAIMQTIIDRLIEEGRRDRVAGSFFFGHGKHGRDKLGYLLPSVAYQMAINLPANGPQFHHPPTVFIDGLDKCDTIDEQLAALDFITKSLLDHHRVPLRFLVASRPESYIRDGFEEARLRSISEQYQVPNDDAEMTVYAKSKFDEIFEKRSRIMTAAGIHRPWPSTDQINELVQRASGQYVFLDTIFRFVDAHRLNPADRLRTVFSRLADSTVFSEMDTIYRLILEQCTNEYWHFVMAIIGVVIFQQQDTNQWLKILAIDCTMACIAEITQYPTCQLQLAAESIAAVLKLEQLRDNVFPSFHHLSFYEFLTNKSRSGNFFCDPELSTKRWEGCICQAFTRSLAAETLLVEPVSKSLVKHVLHHHMPQTWAQTTSAELQELLLRGHSTIQWGTEDFTHWYHVVSLLTKMFATSSWLDDQTSRVRWLVGDFDTPFTIELHRQSLELWKDIADRAFAEMGGKLSKGLLELGKDPSFSASELAMATGLDAEECFLLQDLERMKYNVQGAVYGTQGVNIFIENQAKGWWDRLVGVECPESEREVQKVSLNFQLRPQ
ncbi:hypothetical protein CPB83DRAFT_905257 [Crepidotus variabilis]|uniref:Nephrocystin 3-like N-terminal domain-containing protein n=1 Tax=Crepidotus variabilis TaxID=179855 RepID=A0A9P6EJ46_9AGAR|nr:hypothetical protein CPB83DRAFT_905257 [Crepidotus variabilis]